MSSNTFSVKQVHSCQFSNALRRVTINFPKHTSFFKKKMMVSRGDALKTIQIYTYFTENV